MAVLVLASLCPLCSGCFTAAWAYPTASFVPALPVGPSSQEVRAFRIDVKDDQSSHAGYPEEDRYVMEEMTGRLGEWLLPQAKLSFDYGHQVAGPEPWTQQTAHTLLVRLYRPGYKTVEIQSWDFATPVNWKKVTSRAEQERAIDDLVSTFDRDNQAHISWAADTTRDPERAKTLPRVAEVFRRMAPGSASEDHRAALLFAASEYDLLSRSGDDGGDRELASRVTEKAIALRKFAGD